MLAGRNRPGWSGSRVGPERDPPRSNKPGSEPGSVGLGTGLGRGFAAPEPQQFIDPPAPFRLTGANFRCRLGALDWQREQLQRLYRGPAVAGAALATARVRGRAPDPADQVRAVQNVGRRDRGALRGLQRALRRPHRRVRDVPPMPPAPSPPCGRVGRPLSGLNAAGATHTTGSRSFPRCSAPQG